MLMNTLIMALREIRRNVMRSLLTMLGIVIGVAAVIALVTVGDGATASVTEGISALGDNLVMVSPGAPRMGPGGSTPGAPLEEDDVEAIQRDIMGVEAVAPVASKSSLAIYGNRNWRTTITGTTSAFFTVRGFEIDQGRDFTSADASAARGVCILGATPARELFGSTDPLGENIRVGKLSCEVIGTLGEKGAGMMGMDNDDLIVMPLRAFQQRVAGNRDVSMIYVAVAENRSTSSVKGQLEILFRERRRIGAGEEDDFNVSDMKEIIDTVSGTVSILTALLGAVAAVSLLVGGIGIMNIMLVSVTERTREIGIRLAIGALARDVLLQFLIESVVLASFGGLIGVVVGLLGAFGMARLIDVPFLVSVPMVGIAFAFSGAVGVLFGYLPARKAAGLNPIDALRHE